LFGFSTENFLDDIPNINESLRKNDIEIDDDGRINFYNDDYEGEE